VETGQPSRTAFAAALHRATHQVVDDGRIHTDPLAVRILGADPERLAADAATAPERRPMRWFVAARSRFAEDSLREAVAGGTRQLVVLGAGLDTFAYRSPYAEPGLTVFEVDHPATQAWKRHRLAEAGIAEPPSLTFAPVDFERESLADGLASAGFDAARPAFFCWLGVVPYLTADAVDSTLRFIAGLGGSARVVFDYAEPPTAMPAERREIYEARARRVAAIGEPWITFFEPDTLATKLLAMGFTSIEDVGPAEMGVRYFGLAPDDPRLARLSAGGRGHVIRAEKSISA
jgi:methyltransferase (TIGR00027 family)